MHNEQKICATCIHWRRITTDKTATEDKACDACTNTDSRTADFVPCIVIEKDKVMINKVSGICLACMDYKTSEDCCDINYERSDSYLYYYQPRNIANNTNECTNSESNSTSLKKLEDFSRYFPVDINSGYCGICRYWWERPNNNINGFPVFIPFKRAETDLLLCKGICGHCLINGYEEHKSNENACGKFRRTDLELSYDEKPIGDAYLHYLEDNSFKEAIPVITSRQRYIRSVRMVRALFLYVFYYAASVYSEIGELINKNHEDAEYVDRAIKIRNDIELTYHDIDSFNNEFNWSPPVILRATSVSSDTIRNAIFTSKKKAGSAFNDNILWDLHNYFRISRKSLYGFFGNIRSIETYNNTLFTCKTSAYEIKKYYPNTIFYPIMRMKVNFDEDFIAAFSALIQICSDEEIDTLSQKYIQEFQKAKKHRLKKKTIKSVKTNISNGIGQNMSDVKGNNSYRKISMATGLKEKKIENIFSGKSKPSFSDTCNLCDAIGIPAADVLNNDISKKDLMNPIQRLSDEQSTEIKKSTYMIKLYYTSECIWRLYEYNPRLTTAIVVLYKEVGIDKMHNKYIPEIYKYLSEHHPNECDTICNNDLIKDALLF